MFAGGGAVCWPREGGPFFAPDRRMHDGVEVGNGTTRDDSLPRRLPSSRPAHAALASPPQTFAFCPFLVRSLDSGALVFFFPFFFFGPLPPLGEITQAPQNLPPPSPSDRPFACGPSEASSAVSASSSPGYRVDAHVLLVGCSRPPLTPRPLAGLVWFSLLFRKDMKGINTMKIKKKTKKSIHNPAAIHPCIRPFLHL